MVFQMSLQLTKPQTSTELRGVFHKYMMVLVLVLAISIPIVIGHWRYETQSDSPGLRDFIDGVILSAPFSVGLWLSTTKVGKRFKWITLLLIIPSAVIHGVFFEHLWPVVLFIEGYAIYSLFYKENR